MLPGLPTMAGGMPTMVGGVPKLADGVLVSAGSEPEAVTVCCKLGGGNLISGN